MPHIRTEREREKRELEKYKRGTELRDKEENCLSKSRSTETQEVFLCHRGVGVGWEETAEAGWLIDCPHLCAPSLLYISLLMDFTLFVSLTHKSKVSAVLNRNICGTLSSERRQWCTPLAETTPFHLVFPHLYSFESNQNNFSHIRRNNQGWPQCQDKTILSHRNTSMLNKKTKTVM